MTISRRKAVVGLGALALAGCASDSKFRSYDGPAVTRIQVFKAKREMQLLHNNQLLKAYAFELGFAPTGDKSFIAYARARGLSPGGDIFIHGTPNPFSLEDDWTWGCIAVTNDEIEEIYAMVQTGTPIYIYP